MEKLIKVGHLKEYVRITNEQREKTLEISIQALTSLIAPRAIINYIHRGPIDDKHSSRQQRRRLLRATFVKEWINSVQHIFVKGSVHLVDNIITFLPIDVNHVLQPHENSLILALRVGGFDMRRILIDPDSLVDLLKMLAYRQMGYSSFALKNPRCLLFKFNGATTTSLGDIVFHVQADSVTLSVQFSVINDLSTYNDIIWRAWLHKMKVIPLRTIKWWVTS